jgi:hypothetical protein
MILRSQWPGSRGPFDDDSSMGSSPSMGSLDIATPRRDSGDAAAPCEYPELKTFRTPWRSLGNRRGFFSSRPVSNKISQASVLRSMDPNTRWLWRLPSVGAEGPKISVTALSQRTVAYVYPSSNRWFPAARSVNCKVPNSVEGGKK